MEIPQTMRAMVLRGQKQPLHLTEVPVPRPGPEQVLIRVHACGVCRTDLHILDGDLKEPKLPLILGHQIVGTVVQAGEKASRFTLGLRVGVPWLGYSDGTCRYCRRGQENLCDHPLFPAITSMGVSPSGRWPTSASASPYLILTATLRWLPCCAPG
jgi:propanol-preferring alcohol dehydrogenase